MKTDLQLVLLHHLLMGKFRKRVLEGDPGAVVSGNLSCLNLSATSPLLSVGVLVLIYELVV